MKTLKEPNAAVKQPLADEDRIPEIAYQDVSELAYFKAEKRNFEPGHELDDWLEAEVELVMNKKKVVM